MSENLIHQSVASQVKELAELTGFPCDAFKHQLIDTNVSFAGGPGFQNIFNVTTPDGGGLIITAIDVKTLFDTTDAALGTGAADWRSTFDLNPYGPFAAGSGGVGQIKMQIDSDQLFDTAWDIIINHPVLIGVGGKKNAIIQANPNQPAGKKLQLVTCVVAFSVQAIVVDAVKKNWETQIRTGIPLP